MECRWQCSLPVSSHDKNCYPTMFSSRFSFQNYLFSISLQFIFLASLRWLLFDDLYFSLAVIPFELHLFSKPFKLFYCNNKRKKRMTKRITIKVSNLFHAEIWIKPVHKFKSVGFCLFIQHYTAWKIISAERKKRSCGEQKSRNFNCFFRGALKRIILSSVRTVMNGKNSNWDKIICAFEKHINLSLKASPTDQKKERNTKQSNKKGKSTNILVQIQHNSSAPNYIEL